MCILVIAKIKDPQNLKKYLAGECYFLSTLHVHNLSNNLFNNSVLNNHLNTNHFFILSTSMKIYANSTKLLSGYTSSFNIKLKTIKQMLNLKVISHLCQNLSLQLQILLIIHIVQSTINSNTVNRNHIDHKRGLKNVVFFAQGVCSP